METSLNQVRIVTFESRLSGIMTEAIQRKGAHVISAPSMQEIPLEKNPEVIKFGSELLDGKIDVLIAMTGVGIKYLIESLSHEYELTKVLGALNMVLKVARGPKSVQALRSFGVIPEVIVPEPHTWQDVVQALDASPRGRDLAGARVAIQEYGIENKFLLAALKKREASVIQVPVYRWALPDDVTPLKRAISEVIDGKVQLAFFTNAMQIRNVLKLCSELGVEKEFRAAARKVVVASVGPTTSEALHEEGFQVDFEPSRPKMSHLISETMEQLEPLMQRKLKPGCLLVETREPICQDSKEVNESVFLRACRREQVPYTPVWLMRQAGRYMKDYRRIRNQVSFLELCKNPALAAEVTVMAAERLNTDAAIIFSDLLVVLEPFGCDLSYTPSDGPVITLNQNLESYVDKMPEMRSAETLVFVYEAIKKTKMHLKSSVPLIGFSGAPFTVASYLIEGGASRNFLKTKHFMFQDRALWDALMEKIVRGLSEFLNLQIASGADAIQLFDSWVGCLNESDFGTYVLPHVQRLIAQIQPRVPVIYFGTGTASILTSMKHVGSDVIGVDFRINLDKAWDLVGPSFAVQGNLDPAVLFEGPNFIKEKVRTTLKQAADRPGHIFNLGHGILPQTPEDHVIALVEMVHELSARKGS